jgi:hypothetical protein
MFLRSWQEGLHYTVPVATIPTVKPHRDKQMAISLFRSELKGSRAELHLIRPTKRLQKDWIVAHPPFLWYPARRNLGIRYIGL